MRPPHLNFREGLSIGTGTVKNGQPTAVHEVQKHGHSFFNSFIEVELRMVEFCLSSFFKHIPISATPRNLNPGVAHLEAICGTVKAIRARSRSGMQCPGLRSLHVCWRRSRIRPLLWWSSTKCPLRITMIYPTHFFHTYLRMCLSSLHSNYWRRSILHNLQSKWTQLTLNLRSKWRRQSSNLQRKWSR